MHRTQRAGLLALILLGTVLCGALLPTATATPSAVRVQQASCVLPCANVTQTTPYYTTLVFWGETGIALIAAGIVGLIVGATVYRHWLFILGMAMILVIGITIVVLV